jgi:hypothetical protein
MFWKRKKIPMPITINDCLLLWQMGYEVIFEDGKVAKIRKYK